MEDIRMTKAAFLFPVLIIALIPDPASANAASVPTPDIEKKLITGDNGLNHNETPGFSIEICDWRGGASGAASISVDDAFPSCREILNEYNFKATYYLSCTNKFSQADWDLWQSVYQEGHEIGGHTNNHACVIQDEATLRLDLSSNIDEILTNLNIPSEELSSFAWPCGVTDANTGAIAGEYYVSARGYHINQLEDKEPADFMNLKSINTPYYHAPEQDPPDWFRKADEAEDTGKWANYVFHNHCKDDGAISYLSTKDLWVAPVGKVAKYIKERQNTNIRDVLQTKSVVSFVLTSGLDPTLFNEELTIKVSMMPAHVRAVLVNGRPTAFTSGATDLLFNVKPSGSDNIRIIKEVNSRENGNEIIGPETTHNEQILRPLMKLKNGPGVVVNIWIPGRAKLDNLREHGIKYLFVDVGDTEPNGMLATPEEQIVKFIDLIKSYEEEHDYDFIILPYSEVNTHLYDIDCTFKRNYIATYEHLISLGFDGVYVDIEPVTREQDYLDLLEDLSVICPNDKILGAYAGTVYGSESGKKRISEWQWPLSFFKRVSDRADLMCVPFYDTGSRSREDYESFIRKQVELLAPRECNALLMPAIPTHRQEPETIKNALESYNLVINEYARNPLGDLCIFAEWTTDANEWDIFESWR